MAVAAVLRPGQPRHALPGQAFGVQCVPHQGHLHHLGRRPGDAPRGRPVAVLGIRTVPPRHRLRGERPGHPGRAGAVPTVESAEPLRSSPPSLPFSCPAAVVPSTALPRGSRGRAVPLAGREPRGPGRSAGGAPAPPHLYSPTAVRIYPSPRWSSAGPATPPTEGTPTPMPSSMLLGIIVAALVLIVLIASLRVVREYERLVIFRLGRLRGAIGPGLVLLLPYLDRSVRVDMRVVTLTIPPQEVITCDNVTARVNAAVMSGHRRPRALRVSGGGEPRGRFSPPSTPTTPGLGGGRADLDTLPGPLARTSTSGPYVRSPPSRRCRGVWRCPSSRSRTWKFPR